MPVIGRCLEKKPEERYATFGAFLTDLDAVAKKLHIRLPRVVHVAKEDEELYANAQSYVALGDKDRAMAYLERAYEDRSGWLIWVACGVPFDAFRGDPRFDAIVKRIGAVAPVA